MKFDKVAILGLGNMGAAMVKQFAAKGVPVHAWNRSAGKREQVANLQLPQVTVYVNLTECIQAADLIIMNVLGDEDLKTANGLLKSIPEAAWKGKTIVQFTSQDALSVSAQEKLVIAMGAKLIGGAMLATPEDIGTDHAVFLLSANTTAQAEMEAAQPLVEALGSVKTLSGDVGYAALLDFGLIEALFFGLAGHELCFKLLQKYKAAPEVLQTYADMVESTLVDVSKTVLAVTSKAFLEGNDWEAQGQAFSAGTMLATVTMHTRFVEKMGLARDNFMTEYLKSLAKVKNMEHGSSQVVDVYEQDGKKDE